MAVYIYKDGKFELIGDVEIEFLKGIEAYKDTVLVEVDKKIETVEDYTEYLISILNTLTDQYFYTEAKNRGGYKNMGEIYVDAQANDPDAQFLLKLYDAVWEKEEELENQLNSMTLEELLNLDLQKWAFSQYDQVKNQLEGAGA